MKHVIRLMVVAGLLLWPVPMMAQEQPVPDRSLRDQIIEDARELLDRLETIRSCVENRIRQENEYIDDLNCRLDREASPEKREMLRRVIESSQVMAADLQDQQAGIEKMIDQLQRRLGPLEP